MEFFACIRYVTAAITLLGKHNPLDCYVLCEPNFAQYQSPSAAMRWGLDHEEFP